MKNLKILHLGNIANNGYSNAKFQRQRRLAADALIYNYTYIMGMPEWEDADLRGQSVSDWGQDWSKVNLHGFKRPEWFRQVSWSYPLPGQFWVELLLLVSISLNKIWNSYRNLSRGRKGLRSVGGFIRFAKLYLNARKIRPNLNGYDLIQAYGFDPSLVILSGIRTPTIAFEQGNLREIMAMTPSLGELMLLGYQLAKKIVVTNPDARRILHKYRLKNYVFIPHPLDTGKFIPKETTLSKSLRQKYQTKTIFFAPSRHNWALKGNDRLIKAFARFVSQKDPSALLIFSDWGQEQSKSRSLIKSLGLTKNILWTKPHSKRELVDYYNSADIVFDQFTLGVFGTTVPEALACGRPVITYYNPHLNRWAFPIDPPIINATTSQEIYQAMVKVTSDPNLVKKLKSEARQWIDRFHSSEVVTSKYLRLYQEVLHVK